MEKVVWNIDSVKVGFIMENGSTIWNKEKEFIFLIKHNIKGNGKLIRGMDLEYKYIKKTYMEKIKNIMDNGKIIWEMVGEY